MRFAIINVDKFFWKLKIYKKKNEKKSLFTIQPDIRYPAKPDIRYPAKLLAGYAAKSVSGTTLLFMEPKRFS